MNCYERPLVFLDRIFRFLWRVELRIGVLVIRSKLFVVEYFVEIDLGQLHKLGAVTSSEQVFTYLFYHTVFKMYLDVPIRLTQEVVSLT